MPLGSSNNPGKVLSKCRRRLTDVFNGEPKKSTLLEGDLQKTAYHYRNSRGVLGVTKCRRSSVTRVTRSSTRESRNEYYCADASITDSDSYSGMKPPVQSLLQNSSRNSTSGVMTRLRHKAIISTQIESDVYRDFKVAFYKTNLPLDIISNTSDYGTASEDSKECSDSGQSDSYCCDSLSGIESLQNDPSVDVSNNGWDSDGVGDTVGWDSDADQHYFRHLRESTEVTLIHAGQVSAIIPTTNRSSYRGKFHIRLKTDENTVRSLEVQRVGPIVSMEPHGVQFHKARPALLLVPIALDSGCEKWLTCLCSNTREGQPPRWERLPRKDYTYCAGRLVITARHFSLFTAALEPQVERRVRCRAGGLLRLDAVPGVSVKFPRGCLAQDMTARLCAVLGDQVPEHCSPASPIVMLGPHGAQFDLQRPAVIVTLPVPDYNDIVTRFGAHLSVWQSRTHEGEPFVWELLEVPLSAPSGSPHLPVVSFPVHHFSFFRLVWDILTSSLYEAKMGMSYFYPYISFSMMCQAFMEQSSGDNRFGLEVILYRSDRRLPEATNYRHRVGASLKPKLVRPGRILVRLRSQMFEADVEAGEDLEMAKEEPDFRGRDFEKQYACRFKPEVTVERGTFGKVIVERIISGSCKDPLFEFNLHKTGAESEVEQPVGNERWTVFAMKELAASLQITEGNNWKRFAQYIGFTKSEIKSKLQYSPDPFLAMMNLYNGRGGTPQEFIQALYAVSRELRLGGGSGSHSEGRSSSRSGGSQGSGSHASSSQGSGGRSQFWGFRPWGQVNQDQDSDSGSSPPRPSAKKRLFGAGAKKSVSGSQVAKRRKFSDVSETISSHNSSSEEDVGEKDCVLSGGKASSTDKHKTNQRKLSDKDLWRVSSRIVRKDWRNLGRTLGIEEQVLLNLEHAHQSTGFRECAYQMLLEWRGRKPRRCTFGVLYSALLREDMVAVAKHMVRTLIEEEAAAEDS